MWDGTILGRTRAHHFWLRNLRLGSDLCGTSALSTGLRMVTKLPAMSQNMADWWAARRRRPRNARLVIHSGLCHPRLRNRLAIKAVDRRAAAVPCAKRDHVVREACAAVAIALCR